MPLFFLNLLLFFLLPLFTLPNSFVLCSSLNHEGLALLGFREGVVWDPFGALSSWNGGGEDDDSPCSWFGVECSDGKVVALNLEGMSLRGKLTPDLGKLAHMKSIVLRNNSFYGTIPREVVVLKELEVLDLGYNDLTGPLPFELGDSNISLAMISLDNNRLLDVIFTEQYKFMLSANQDESKTNSATHRAPCDENRFSWSTGHFPAQRVLLQAPKASLSPSKKSHTSPKGSLAGPTSLSPGSSPLLSPSGKPSAPAPKMKNAPPPPMMKKAPAPPPKTKKAPASAPKSNKAPASSPTPAPALAPTPAHSPAPAPTPTPAHAPAPAPAIKRAPASPPKATPPAASPASHNSTTELSSASNSSHKGHPVLIGLSLAVGSLVVIVAVVAIFVCRSSKIVTVNPWATGLTGPLQKALVSGVPKLKRSELETACEDFSNVIGNLTDSTVYKGTLSNGVEIAVVSSMITSSRQWSKHLQTQFRKKIETLSKVNFKNFVNVVGYCEQEKPFTRMMVFEYAPNGTLFEHLHIQESERLDWKMRLRIIMGMAYCLDHMHQLDPPIPHRDLHSSSVHLSEDYAAKVSDFSFWTEATSKKMNSSSMRSPSMQLLEGSMTDIESNVYSFGILLFEIITGKIPYTDDGKVDGWVWEYLGGKELPREAIDQTLDTFQEEEAQQLFQIMKDCVNPDITERPTMRDITLRLKELITMEPDMAAPRLSPLWWAELEILTT